MTESLLQEAARKRELARIIRHRAERCDDGRVYRSEMARAQALDMEATRLAAQAKTSSSSD